MRITYDAAADAAYIYLSNGGESVTTTRVDEDIHIDLNHKDQIIGIEVLSASKRMLISEIEHYATPIDAHWTTLSEALQSEGAREFPVAASKPRWNYKVKEVGLDYVTVQDERRETRRVTARQLLARQPRDPLIEALRAMGNYPDDQDEVETK